MSLFHSPKVVTDGLVFYYDMSNTQKSWKGAPTTNLVTYPLADWNGSSFALSYDYKGNGVGNATQTFYTSVETPLGDYSGVMKYTTGSAGITTYPDGYKYWAIRINGLTAGVTYTFSYYAKASIASNFANGQLWRDTGTDYGPSGDWNPTFTTEWRRYSTTRTMVGTYLDYFPIHSGTLTGGHTIYYWGFQMEVGSFATPFVVGTRSNTQAIVDLTGNNTLTATSLTYNSDGTFSFNGSGNNISIGSFGGYSTNITCEAWFKTTSGATWKNIMCGPINDVIFTVNGGLLNFGCQGSSPIPHANYSTTTVNTGAWFHGVATYNGSNVRIYINGNLESTNARTGTITAGAKNIGSNSGGSSEYFNGTIDNVKMYNRPLSATEIAQNFNAQRTRYGI